MTEENLGDLLRSINLRLERMEKKNKENEIEKQKQDTRMDAMADMLLKATRKIGEIEMRILVVEILLNLLMKIGGLKLIFLNLMEIMIVNPFLIG
ncbi:unnamed protein product [Amaranthus hypochondriacus]